MSATTEPAPRKHSRVSFNQSAPQRAPTEIKQARLPQGVDDIVDRFYKQLKETSLDPSQIKPDDIIDVVVHIMHAVEGVGAKGLGLSGPQKKQVVTKTALRLVGDIENVNHQLLLKAVVQFVVPSIIDTVVSASKGQLNINSVVEAVKQTRTFCCA